MPKLPGRPCAQPGCPGLAQPGSSRCVDHALPARPRTSRLSPSARGYDAAWRKRRAAYLLAYPLCALCGAAATEVDHIVPLRRGGADDESNWQALCHTCHSRKTARENGGYGNRERERGVGGSNL